MEATARTPHTVVIPISIRIEQVISVQVTTVHIVHVKVRITTVAINARRRFFLQLIP